MLVSTKQKQIFNHQEYIQIYKNLKKKIPYFDNQDALWNSCKATRSWQALYKQVLNIIFLYFLTIL